MNERKNRDDAKESCGLRRTWIRSPEEGTMDCLTCRRVLPCMTDKFENEWIPSWEGTRKECFATRLSLLQTQCWWCPFPRGNNGMDPSCCCRRRLGRKPQVDRSSLLERCLMMTLSVTREKAWNMPQHQKSCPMSGAAGFLNTASLEKLWDPACLLHTHTVPPCHNLIKEKLLQLVAAWNLLLLVDGYYRGCIYKCTWRSNCLCVLQNEYCGGWPPCSSLRRWIMEEEGQQLHIRSALGSLIVATICALDSVALASAAVSTTRPMVATWCNLWTATFFHPFCLLHHRQHHLLAACWHLFWIS